MLRRGFAGKAQAIALAASEGFGIWSKSSLVRCQDNSGRPYYSQYFYDFCYYRCVLIRTSCILFFTGRKKRYSGRFPVDDVDFSNSRSLGWYDRFSCGRKLGELVAFLYSEAWHLLCHG